MLRKINFFAPGRGPTGYDEVGRQMLMEMYRQGMLVHYEHFDGWSAHRIVLDAEVEEVMRRTSEMPVQDAPLLALCLPEQVQATATRRVINYTMFEATRIPRAWVHKAMECDLVVLPSHAAVAAWLQSDVPEHKLTRVPPGLDPRIWRDPVPPFHNSETKRYSKRFLVCQELTERKNIVGILEAWLRATDRDKHDACMVMKVGSYTRRRLGDLESLVEQVEEKVGKKRQEAAPIYKHVTPLSDDEMLSLIDHCTHYLSMSCGEGWDMTCFKAAALGKEIIAPYHTGYQDYLTDGLARLIKNNVLEDALQTGPTGRLYRGALWRRPDVEEAAQHLRDALAERGSPNSEQLAMRVRQRYSWQSTVSRLRTVIGEDRAYPPRIAKTKSYSLAVVCSTIGSPACGIDDYTQHLVGGIFSNHHPEYTSDNVMIVGGRMADRVEMLEESLGNDVFPQVVHIQHEYQFFSTERLRLLLRQLRQAGIRSVVTMHTVNDEAYLHNAMLVANADVIILHTPIAVEILRSQSQAMVTDCVKDLPLGLRAWRQEHGRWGDRTAELALIPMGCSPPLRDISDGGPPTPAQAAQVPDGRFIIGFFGFTYHHKGIHRLLLNFPAFQDECPDPFLLLVASKPQQDTIGYYEQCHHIVHSTGITTRDMLWVDHHLPEDEVVRLLDLCDLIVLPYEEYGGVGISAAGRTCLRVTHPRIITSDTSYFSDLPCPKFGDDDLMVNLIGECSSDPERIDVDKLREFRDVHSWPQVARKHIDIYEGVNGSTDNQV